MRALMDASQAGNRSGTGRHVTELCRALTGMDDAGSWTVLCPPGFHPGDRFHRIALPGGPVRRRLTIWARIGSWCRDSKADLVYFPSSAAVSGCPCPMVMQVHDLCYRAHPEWFPASRRAWYSMSIDRPARRADLILADSQSTADDLCRLLRIPAERIKVVYLGVSERFRPLSPEETGRMRHQLGCPDGYLLFVGTIEPRKNLARLARAWDRIAEDIRLPLVVAGRRGWRCGEWDDTLRSLRHAPMLAGHVADEDLPRLVGAATALVWPSLMEGFGLPPLEAMACGVPVITSNRSSLPEICGDAALLVDPESEMALAEAMRAVATETSLQERLRAAGLNRAAGFTWESCARRTVEALSQVSGGRSAG
ncbi:MAG TPA: glycosyltransferase family 1 protein [Candidatus Hydrogenedentes bacterium]|nr:glycosyltransferase family 1 protein [Candidatus Hydrogenedentota bacterium]